MFNQTTYSLVRSVTLHNITDYIGASLLHYLLFKQVCDKFVNMDICIVIDDDIVDQIASF